MPGKRDGKASDLTIVVLREIRDEVKGLRGEVSQLRGDVTELRGEVTQTNSRLDQTNERLDQTNRRLNEGFGALRAEMHEGFDQLGKRIDNVLLGEHRHEHEELRGRVERLERHLGLEPR